MERLFIGALGILLLPFTPPSAHAEFSSCARFASRLAGMIADVAADPAGVGTVTDETVLVAECLRDAPSSACGDMVRSYTTELQRLLRMRRGGNHAPIQALTAEAQRLQGECLNSQR